MSIIHAFRNTEEILGFSLDGLTPGYQCLSRYFTFHNFEHLHQELDYRTLAAVYAGKDQMMRYLTLRKGVHLTLPLFRV